MTGTPTAGERGKLSVVYAWRGVGAIWILATAIIRSAWPGEGFRGHTLFLGSYPLAVFAVMSGFVLGLGVTASGRPEMPDLRIYAAKRLVRFIPIVWAAVLVTIALDALWLGDVSGTAWDATLPVSASASVVQMLFLPGFITNTGPNPGAVGVALLVHCSIAFPALLWVWRRVGAVVMAGIGIAIVVVAELVDTTRIGPTTLAIGLFAFGMGVAGVATEPGLVPAARRAAPWWIVAAVVSAVLAIALAMAGPYRFLGHQPLVSIGIAVVVAATVLHVMDNPVSYAAKVANFYPVRAVGVMSLSVCLVSGLVVQILWKVFCDGSGLSSGAVAVILTLGSPFVFAIAIEAAHWFERPCLAGPDRDAFFAQIKLIERTPQPSGPALAAAPTPLAAAPVTDALDEPAPSVVVPLTGAPVPAPLLRQLAPLKDASPRPLVGLASLDEDPPPHHQVVTAARRAELPPPPAVRHRTDEKVIDLRELPPPSIDLREPPVAGGARRSRLAPPLPPPDPRSLVA